MRDASWQPAYLLHARAYRETSVLADWFLPEQGRVASVLRGARRKGRSMPALFQPFFIQLNGTGDLKSVVHCEHAGDALNLRGGTLFSGLYMNELLVRLLPRELPVPELFVAYGGALGELSELDGRVMAELEPILRRFERQLLEAMGQGIGESVRADTQQPLEAEAYYLYYPAHGWLPAKSGQQGACLGEDIMAVAADDVSTPVRRRLAKWMYRTALEPLLAGRPLKSRDLFASLVLNSAAPAAAADNSAEDSSAENNKES